MLYRTHVLREGLRLDEVLSSSGMQVILEADRLRVLPRREALAFWEAWIRSQGR